MSNNNLSFHSIIEPTWNSRPHIAQEQYNPYTAPNIILPQNNVFPISTLNTLSTGGGQPQSFLPSTPNVEQRFKIYQPEEQEKIQQLQKKILLVEKTIKNNEKEALTSKQQLMILNSQLALLHNPNNTGAKQSRTRATNKLKTIQSEQTGPSAEMIAKISQKWIELNNRDEQRKNTRIFLDNKLYFPKEHRFSNLQCPQHSSILINGHSLNANTVTRAGKTDHPIKSGMNLIASQAPMKSTEEHFWKYIFDNYFYIIDLTTPNDQITAYYPTNPGAIYKSGPFEIQLTKEDGIKREYRITNTITKEEKTIQRIHCNNWTDFSGGSIPTLDDLVRRMTGENNTFWLHCRAGVGRTGTLITAALLFERIKDNNISKADLFYLIPEIIDQIREERGPGCVQTLEQFNMLFDYGFYLIDQQHLGLL